MTRSGDSALLEIRDLHKRFGDKRVLEGVDLSVRRGEALYLIGTSGVGKSVTIKHLIGLLAPDSGEIWFDGARIDTLSERAFYPVRKRIGMVFQQATLFDAMTLRENIALPLRVHGGLSHAAALEAAEARLAEVHLQDHVDRYPGTLGDGIRKRAAIARTLTLEPELLLLDEPTTGLDPVSARRVDALIRELVEQRGVTALVVSHDLASIFGVADRVALLYRGRVHVCGAPEALRDSDEPVIRQFLSGSATGPMDTPGF
ncbi:ABC transporter ATP-binding protein [Haliangium ochraceum]|uniref:ABC transporter related protein n=1 Tax=Haliangium ochraceum (strain DSM 14365 / JCM 11303 / SMP-2) TaxID=502025 RepID=D0LVA0_HALO1|nr:ATP-binding cassette domain-containing protein [Haliangium ochraceum]ACY15941.1 ABC transporter related protein [Haliangium ochraceum DSM 14365]